MKEMNIDELKKCQLEILDYIVYFCDNNKINYFLDSGTLLGCIRHKGYIPWDDDIDIGMLRDDFDKFKSLFSERDNYKFVSAELGNQYPYPFGKVLDMTTLLYEPDEKGIQSCVNIDIFVYDNAPDDEKEVNRMFNVRDFYTLLNSLQYSGIYSESKLKMMVCDMARSILKLFPRGYFAEKIILNEKKYMNKECSRVGNFSSVSRVVCTKDVFKEFLYGSFEGKKYKIPIGYDEWLRCFYGDYMELPPIEKQKSHHKFQAYKL